MIEWTYQVNHHLDHNVLVSLDPGKHASGFGIFVDRELVACGMAESSADLLYHWEAYPDRACFGRGWPELVVMELPKIYDKRRWKGDPNDLLPIVAAGAMILGAVRPAKFKTVLPEEWKGQTPKKVQNTRDRRALSSIELAVLDAVPVSAGKLHNVIDGIGIGLRELNRHLR